MIDWSQLLGNALCLGVGVVLPLWGLNRLLHPIVGKAMMEGEKWEAEQREKKQ